MEDWKEFVKRRHICSVPGCRNKESYKIARTSGGSTVLFLCPDCAAQAFAGMLGIDVLSCENIQDVYSVVKSRAGKSGSRAKTTKTKT
ncbi:MAG: hypothetical protein HFE77_05795 [Clostridiales bacterium]|nr:hypothetical protein [Clostridiales bacterium]